jgi:competence protein ComEC
MVTKMIKISPLVIAAIAAAFAVYAPKPLLLFVVITLFIISLAAWLIVQKKNWREKVGRCLPPRYIPVCVTAILLGMLAGLWSVSRIQDFAPGVPAESVTSLKGILLDDPRSLSSNSQKGAPPDTKDPSTERGMAILQLKESGANLQGCAVRASARGNALVFFPQGTMPRLKGFGRKAQIFIEGGFLPDDKPNRSGTPVFRAVSVHVVKDAPALEQLRSKVRLSILKRLETKKWGGLAAALLLGTKENLDDDIAQAFIKAGLSHVLAISGMHLAFLSALLAFILKRPLGKKGAILAGLVFIVLYVFLVGPQPSLVRAGLMYAMGSVLILSGAKGQALALLGLAFIVQIIWNPESAYSASFILSYLALGGILLLSEETIKLLKGRLPTPLLGGFGASVGAFLATAPVTASLFGILYPAGIVATFFAAPLASVIMTLAIIYLILGIIPFLAFITSKLLDVSVFLLQYTVSLFAKLPGFSLATLITCIAALCIITALLALSAKQEKHRSYLAPFGL